MTSQSKCILASAALAGLLTSAGTFGQRETSLAAKSATSRIYITASDKNDSPVTLDLPQLTVSVDKQNAQVISLSRAKSDDLLFALLIDVSTSERKSDNSIRLAAISIFQSLAAAGDQGYLGFFDLSLRTSHQPLSSQEAQRAINAVPFGGGSAVYDAIGDACSHVLSRQHNPDHPRRIIVILSDGDDNNSRANSADIEEIAEREEIQVFSLIVPGGAHSAKFLGELSRRTGGRSIAPVKLEEGVGPLLDEVNNQWALDIVPPQVTDKKLHSLACTSTQGNLQITAAVRIPLQ